MNNPRYIDAMRAPLRNVITEPGAANVDRGHIIFMGKDRMEVAYFEPRKTPWLALACLLAVIGMVVLVLVALANGWVRL